jgi:DNA polymerase
LLGRLLESVDLSREQVYVTNVVKYRPVDPIDKKNRAPSRQESRDSLPYLKREMRILRPPIIVTLGAHALRAVLPDSPPISVVHGTVLSTRKGKPVVALYHPATALYSPSMLPSLLKDFMAVSDLLSSEVFHE